MVLVISYFFSFILNKLEIFMQMKFLEIQFTILDDFDTQLARKGGIDGDGLGVGQSSHGVWSYISFPETIAIIKCSVQRVKFMDGSSWPVTY